jgi:hypothetical protein
MEVSECVFGSKDSPPPPASRSGKVSQISSDIVLYSSYSISHTLLPFDRRRKVCFGKLFEALHGGPPRSGCVGQTPQEKEGNHGAVITHPSAAESPARSPAAGGQPGNGSESRQSLPVRGQLSRGFAREPPASDTPAPHASVTWAASPGGSRPAELPRSLPLSRLPGMLSLPLRPRELSRTPPRPRRVPAAERNISQADWPGYP